jgi:deoxyribose-phosphate aldolase
MTLRDIAQMIDHSLLHPTMTDADIIAGCAIARRYGTATVCVKPYSILLAKEQLKGCAVAICAVIGFPHGNSTTQIKLRETQDALLAGAHEIDMVINIGKALGGQYDYVKDEIRAINRACQRHNAPLKVIFENDFLKDEHIIELCKICTELNVAYVKTSTGYGFVKQPDGKYDYKGATEHQVKLMRQHCPSFVKIKAAGGIRTLDDLLKFKELGCTRIGATATEAMLEEAKKRGMV